MATFVDALRAAVDGHTCQIHWPRMSNSLATHHGRCLSRSAAMQAIRYAKLPLFMDALRDQGGDWTHRRVLQSTAQLSVEVHGHGKNPDL